MWKRASGNPKEALLVIACVTTVPLTPKSFGSFEGHFRQNYIKLA